MRKGYALTQQLGERCYQRTSIGLVTGWQRVGNGLAIHWKRVDNSQHVVNALTIQLYVLETASNFLLAMRWFEQWFVNMLATHQHVENGLSTR